jgi:VCBS repeat-containing protein
MSDGVGFDVFALGEASEFIDEIALVPNLDLTSGTQVEVAFPGTGDGAGETVNFTLSSNVPAGQPIVVDVQNGENRSVGERTVNEAWIRIDTAVASVEQAVLTPAGAAGALNASAIDVKTDVPGNLAEVSSDAGLQIVFVDATVDDVQQLIDGIDPTFEVHVVEPGVDGVAFMASVVEGRSGIDAIHVVSHGDEGEFRLGSSFVDQSNIEGQYADELASIGDALAENADFLVYGCDFGTDAAAVAALAAATGADVAASDDLTGHASRGADWDLEVQTGSIEAGIPITAQLQQEWSGILGSFSLNWNNVVWTNGDLSNTFTLTSSTGQTVDVTIIVSEVVNSPVPFTFLGIERPAEDSAAGGALGGIDDLAVTTNPPNTGTAQMQIDVNFTLGGSGAGGTPVTVDNINFVISDIDWRQDSANNSRDQVTVNSAGTVTLSEVNSADNTVAISGNVATADIISGSNNDDRGSVNTSITNGASSFTILYDDVIGSGNPTVRSVGILGGFSFSADVLPDLGTTAEDVTLTVTAANGVLANDADTSGTIEVQTFTIAGVAGTFNAGQTASLTEGALTINDDGSYVFVPAQGFTGTVPQVTYTTLDGGASESSTLDITVTPDGTPDWNITGTASVAEGNTATYTISIDEVDTLLPGQSVSVDLSLGDVDTSSADYADFIASVTAAVNADPNYTLTGNTLTYTEPAAAYTQNFTQGGAAGATSIVGQSGTTVLGNSNSDDATVATSIGFAFDYFGTSYTSVNVDTNGYVTFGGAPASTYNNGNIAAGNVLGGNPAIAAFWDDLSPNVSGDIYVRTTGSPGSRQFIVEWNNVPYFNAGSSDGGTVQLVLDEATGQIEILYLDTDFSGANTSHDNGASATIGIQNGTAGSGTEFLQDSPNANLNGSSLTYTPDAPYTPLTFTLDTVNDANYEGDEDYQITLSNPGNSNIGTPSVTTTIVDDENPPVARDDAETTDQDTIVTDNVLADNGNGVDSDPDSDPLAVTEINGAVFTPGTPIVLASGAEVTMQPNGTYVYNPNGQFDYLPAGQSTTDTFTYTISDGTGGTDTATVTITINGVNDAPTEITKLYSETYRDALINCGLWNNFDVLAGSVLVDLDNVVDNDVNDTHTFSFVDGTGTPVIDPDLEIINNELVIRADASLVPGTITNRTVIIRVDDGEGGFVDQSYSFDLRLNDGPYTGSNTHDIGLGTVGADTMQGGNGLDRLYGDDGDDFLYGDADSDILEGGAGADTLDGGSGRDAASYMGSTTGITVDMMNAGANTGDAIGDSFASIEGVWGSSFDDNLFGDNNDNTLIGSHGDDFLDGRGGNDLLQGGTGSDTFMFSNGSNNDVIIDFAAGPSLGDVVNVSDFGFADFATLQSAMSVINGHVVLQLDTNNSVEFWGIGSISQLHENDFIL